MTNKMTAVIFGLMSLVVSPNSGLAQAIPPRAGYTTNGGSFWLGGKAGEGLYVRRGTGSMYKATLVFHSHHDGFWWYRETGTPSFFGFSAHPSACCRYAIWRGHWDTNDVWHGSFFGYGEKVKLQPHGFAKQQLNSYKDVQNLFNKFVNDNQIDLSGSPHSDFWNTFTYDQFTSGDVPGVKGVGILVKGNGDKSNIVAILRGPITVSVGGIQRTLPQMPPDGPYMPSETVNALADWINRNCPP